MKDLKNLLTPDSGPAGGNPPLSPPGQVNPRIRLVVTLLALAGLVMALRAFHLMVIQQGRLSGLARQQYQRAMQLEGRRGPIQDREGGALAVSLASESIFINPAQLTDTAGAAWALARILGMDPRHLTNELSRDRAFVWVKRQAGPEEVRRVKALNLAGVGFLTEYRRVYPRRELAGAVVGFTGVDHNGLAGVEYAFDSVLRGTRVERLVDRDALGRTVVAAGGGEPDSGGSVRLTLHPAIQWIAEQELNKAVAQHGALGGVAVVMDVSTGEILALANAPGFDANRFQEYSPAHLGNRAVTDGYEPGSTFKIITLAAALEEEAVTPDLKLFCENGTFPVADSVIHDTSAHGWLGLEDMLAVSSNICMAKVGMMIPKPAFHDYMEAFGFGQRAGLFVGQDGRVWSAEATGDLPPPEKWTQVDWAALSFGHGLLVSPVQMTAAVNTVAAGGEWVRPRLVAELRNRRGEEISFGQVTRRRVISRQTAAWVGHAMTVVVERGTGTQAQVYGYPVAGKTGTTEKFEFEAKGYSKTRQIASFAGFLPADHPRITILVVVEEPQEGRSGGAAAAPVFREIARRTLPLLGVPPVGARMAGGRP
ncbi:MAG: penicillin-binding protein 2 [Deltaproteobacteria bacterium]|nr:penicillin-binding protein 2 [Deltaproteobacteria bacterium]